MKQTFEHAEHGAQSPGADPGATGVGVFERLPPLSPADTSQGGWSAALPLCLVSDGASDESTNFRDREEAGDPFAFLTVYALNTAVLLFAFPVGMALLVFNILGGENLRTTAHVMGLTGLASALPYLGLSIPFLT
ncbi:MAG: hypothetical protein AAF566_04485 [Pseudomonadota bacterium]